MQFHLLSFEGPDGYARAGGIASRITGLSRALADAGFDTHLWFVGDPGEPGHDKEGSVNLHRWCQWISRHHPGGVYDGESGKADDYAASLPPYLLSEYLGPVVSRGERAVVLAEEWHTVHAVFHLDWLLRRAGMRDRVEILWNANNTFGFDAIDWARLARAARITTVSRYMAHRMREQGVEALVIPNGLNAEAFGAADPAAFAQLKYRFRERILLTKMARWDPDKRWLETIDTVADLKRQGGRPLLVARGGMEGHGSDVLSRARHAGLEVVHRDLPEPGPYGLIEALRGINGADMVVLRSHVDPLARRLLFRSADAVLANSRHEPFGLVGLEAMAVGGLACTGCSGEDYAVPGHNAMVLQTEDPSEFSRLFGVVHANPGLRRMMRRAGRRTAEQFAWPRVVEGSLLPRVGAVARAPHRPIAPSRRLATALQHRGADWLEGLWRGTAVRAG